jgi:hypothetical protein
VGIGLQDHPKTTWTIMGDDHECIIKCDGMTLTVDEPAHKSRAVLTPFDKETFWTIQEHHGHTFIMLKDTSFALSLDNGNVVIETKRKAKMSQKWNISLLKTV